MHVFDQLLTRPPDTFAERAKLRKRQDELTELLREIKIPGEAEIQERWNQADADKTDGEEPEEMIISPIESGTGGGG